MLTALEITLPANDRDVMAREAALRAAKKWEAVAACDHRSFVVRKANDNARFHRRQLGVIEARITARQSMKGGVS